MVITISCGRMRFRPSGRARPCARTRRLLRFDATLVLPRQRCPMKRRSVHNESLARIWSWRHAGLRRRNRPHRHRRSQDTSSNCAAAGAGCAGRLPQIRQSAKGSGMMPRLVIEDDEHRRLEPATSASHADVVERSFLRRIVIRVVALAAFIALWRLASDQTFDFAFAAKWHKISLAGAYDASRVDAEPGRAPDSERVTYFAPRSQENTCGNTNSSLAASRTTSGSARGKTHDLSDWQAVERTKRGDTPSSQEMMRLHVSEKRSRSLPPARRFAILAAWKPGLIRQNTLPPRKRRASSLRVSNSSAAQSCGRKHSAVSFGMFKALLGVAAWCSMAAGLLASGGGGGCGGGGGGGGFCGFGGDSGSPIRAPEGRRGRRRGRSDDKAGSHEMGIFGI